MSRTAVFIFLLVIVLLPLAALAHHSYAMFDGTQKRTVSGTVAKLEWRNPHVFLWVYVADVDAKSGFTLYAFENGSTGVLSRLGWSRTTFAVGEKLVIEYWPLKDGRPGGHFHKATRADGQAIEGAGGPRVPAAPAPASPGAR